jgi:hypothetical protein
MVAPNLTGVAVVHQTVGRLGISRFGISRFGISFVIVLMRMPMLQDFPQPLHRNLVSAMTGPSPIPDLEPAAFAFQRSRRRECGNLSRSLPGQATLLGASSRHQRPAIVVIIRERMLRRTKLIGREYGSK